MSYVPGCEHDVFVSYAHVDDEPIDKGDGWVTTLVSKLNRLLDQNLGQRSSLWIDRKLARHVQITPEILNTLEKTATLLVVLSPAYLKSDWCERERATFLKIVNERMRSGSRVFIVERHKVELEDRPREFGDLIGYSFWTQDSRSGTPRTLGVPRPDSDEVEYYRTLSRLAWELKEELERLAKAGTNGPIPWDDEDKGDDEGKKAETVTIYLAETTDDLDRSRTKLKQSFEQQGFRVVPDIWYPREPEGFRAAVAKDLDNATLFVQLLSSWPGRRLKSTTEESYVSYQHDCAKEKKLPIFQWRDPKLNLEEIDPDVTDAFHLRLLNGPSVQARPISDFIREIIGEAKCILAEKPEIPSHTGSAIISVDVGPRDRALTNELRNYLTKEGCTVITPLEKGRPNEIRKDFEQRVKECEAFIIIYGEAANFWVRERIVKAKKLERLRKYPFLGLAVYEGPPKPKDPLNLYDLALEIIHCEDGFDPNKLEPFLNVVKEGVRRWMARNGEDNN
ncbi:MAG: toll/interleukin-1 receptor domain-containing protein [Planctomycetota bacterium]|jgi:hypothetical protein